MEDDYKAWSIYARHFALTQDPKKSLQWTRYEMWAEKRRLARFKLEADRLASESLARASAGRR